MNKIVNKSETCEICNIYHRSNSRLVVGLSMATEFNEIVAIDLKKFEGKLILHAINHWLSAATFAASKHREKLSAPSLKFGYQYLDHLLNSLVIMVVNLVTLTLMTCMSRYI